MGKEVKGKGSFEQGLVRELAALLDETGLGEIEIEREGVRVRVARRVAIEAAIGGMPAQAASPSTEQRCARNAKERADDIDDQGFDTDMQKKVYDKTYADCVAMVRQTEAR